MSRSREEQQTVRRRKHRCLRRPPGCLIKEVLVLGWFLLRSLQIARAVPATRSSFFGNEKNRSNRPLLIVFIVRVFHTSICRDGCHLWIGRFHYCCYELASVPLVTIPAGENVTECECRKKGDEKQISENQMGNPIQVALELLFYRGAYSLLLPRFLEKTCRRGASKMQQRSELRRVTIPNTLQSCSESSCAVPHHRVAGSTGTVVSDSRLSRPLA